jgi:hypothetical protein
MSSGLLGALLFAAPAIALWALLVLGRYPGERAIARIAGRRRAAPHQVAPRGPLRRASRRIRGLGERLAGSQAGRAPPPARTVPTPLTH